MENKIPKIIHYCWLSGNKKPAEIQKSIDSWSEIMPDYEIMCWDMERFDIKSSLFVETACAERKWAFAADYIRLYALYTYGGIYFDSDVTVYQRFDPFLKHSAFSGTHVNIQIFERQIAEGTPGCVGLEAAVIGSMPNHPWIKALLSLYDNKRFENTETFLRKFVMTNYIADHSAKYFNFKFSPIYQVLDTDVHIYPPDVFSTIVGQSPIKYSTHWCANAWVDYTNKKYTPIEKAKSFIIHDLIGEKNWIGIKKKLGKRV